MLIKGIALTALVASTPFALFVTQDPAVVDAQDPRPAEQRADQKERLRTRAELNRTRAELHAAQRDVQLLKKQLGAALDRLDGHYQQQRDRDCSPSRSRMLMSHYQWLRDQGHQDRAQLALGKVVERVGDDTGRLNSVAWDLMTDKETAGKFDELALAMTKRMQELAKTGRRHRIRHNQLDTIALAHFLNGQVEQAIALQQQAIKGGGTSDDYRRRLRTYEAAQSALAAAQRKAVPAATMVAKADEEE